MKRIGWGILGVIFAVLYPLQTFALTTVPSDPSAIKVSGPLLITGYSFSGHSLRYAQLYNASSEVAVLDGWQVSVEYGTSQQIYTALSGQVAPGKYVSVGNQSILPSATFSFSDAIIASDPAITSVTLQAPSDSNFLNEVASPSIITSTPRVAGTPATFYFARNISTTTGNYLSTFAAFLPSNTFSLVSDPLYVAPLSLLITIVEVFPDSPTCAPFSSGICSDYVKLYNPTATQFDLATLRVRTGTYGQSPSSSNTHRLSGVLAPGGYISFPLTLSSSGSWVWLEDTYGTTKYESTIVGYPSSSAHDNEAWSLNPLTNQWQWTIYPTPGNAINQFVVPEAINSCEGLTINEIAANVATEDQFIEVTNSTESAIDATGCIVQTNRSTTKSYVIQGEVSVDEHRVIYIKDTDLTLTKTTSGTVYVLSSDGLSEVDQAEYDGLAENSSWAEFEGVWQQTFGVTPGAKNVIQTFLPCDVGYERSTETGYCNKVVVASNQLADCDEGKYRSVETNRCRAFEVVSSLSACENDQYRSPETNRCRSLVSTASMLTPCAPNQERNQDTNRCRTVEASSGLAPCAANQERNPDTNRCRNKTSTSAADFPIEAVAQSGEATMGWWAFGGVGTLAAGYAGWEWRREVAGIIKKFGLFFTGRF